MAACADPKKPLRGLANLPPEQRRLIAQIGINTRLSRMTPEQRRESTAPARAGLLRKFANEIDPDHRLPDDVRQAMAVQARRAWMQSLTLKRRRNAQRRREATEAGGSP